MLRLIKCLFKISFPRENEAVKHDLVKSELQCLTVFCCHGNKSAILFFNSIFRTTLAVSGETNLVLEKLWLFNHKRADFLSSKLWILLSLFSPFKIVCRYKVRAVAD